jgi:hypothetical protein
MANPTAYGGEGILLFDELEGLFVFPLGNQGHISLDADVGRTGGFAGGGPSFFNGKGTGHGLRV